MDVYLFVLVAVAAMLAYAQPLPYVFSRCMFSRNKVIIVR